MIKKILGLTIFGFCIINFSYAITYSINNVYKVGTYYESPLDSSIEFTVLKGGNVYSRKLGLTQNILTLMSYSQTLNIRRLYFWWNDGVPYFYYYRNSNNFRYGKFNKYAICNEIIDTGPQNMSNCTEDNLTDYSILGNFFSSIVNNDNWGFKWSNDEYLTICFSSNSFGKSICFYSNYYDYVSMEDNLDFNNFPTDIQGKAPGTVIGGNTQGNRNNNNYYCPTIGQLLNNFGDNYNTGLCYNNTLYYNNQTNQFETIEKKDIFTVFTGFDEFKNRVSIYYNNCKAPATQQYCANAFSGEFEKYSIISNATNNNVIIKDLWNYCNMSLNYDPNWSTCVASGYIAEPPTEEEFIEMITNGEITNISTPGSGNILNNLLGTGQTRNNIATRDIFGQLDQLKEKLASIFNGRNGTNGIIPDYIMWLILTTLLLTVLIKK